MSDKVYNVPEWASRPSSTTKSTGDVQRPSSIPRCSGASRQGIDDQALTKVKNTSYDPTRSSNGTRTARSTFAPTASTGH